MRWERLFDDLEARLEAQGRADAEAEAVDLVRAERARLGVLDRLRAQMGATLVWSLAGGRSPVSARLLDIGADWVLVGADRGQMLIPIAAVQTIGGLSRSALPDPSEVVRRLGIGLVLRGLSRDRALVSVRLADDRTVSGTIDRVGADHIDVAVHPQDVPRRAPAVLEVRCVLLTAIVAVTVH
jgi:hypothetical protein